MGRAPMSPNFMTNCRASTMFTRKFDQSLRVILEISQTLSKFRVNMARAAVCH